MEELTKSVILKFKSIDNSIPIKNLEKYFQDHEIKQNAGFAIYSAISTSFEDENKDKKIDENSKDIKMITLIALAVIIMLDDKKDIKTQRKSPLNLIKESGFYVEYDQSIRNWRSPKTVHNEQSFKHLFFMIKEFSLTIKNWIFSDVFDKDKFWEILNSIDDKYIDKEKLTEITKK